VQNALFRDAVYHAIGLGAVILKEAVNFKQWFEVELKMVLEMPPAQHNPMAARILCMRAVWLIGRFSSHLSEQECHSIYGALVTQLRCLDVVVAMQAAHVLSHMRFNAALLIEMSSVHPLKSSFDQFLGDALGGCFDLLDRVHEIECKIVLLKLVSILVESVGKRSAPHLGRIVQMLPKVCASAGAPASEEQSRGVARLQNSVVLVMSHMLRALGPVPMQMEEVRALLLPLLHFSTDPTGAQKVHMMEDGLGLWLAVLNNCSELNDALVALFPRLSIILQGLGKGEKERPVALAILESYVILGGAAFMSVYSQAVAAMVDDVIGVMSDSETLAALNVVDTLLQLFPQEGPVLLAATLIRMVDRITMVPGVDLLQSSAPFTSRLGLDGPNRLSPWLSQSYLTVLSRAISNLPDRFGDMCQNDPQRQNKYVMALLDVIGMVSDWQGCKLLALSACLLIRMGVGSAITHLGPLVQWVLVAITDLKQSEDAVQERLNDIPSAEEHPLANKVALLARQDMIYRVDLAGSCRSALASAEATMGSEAFQQAIRAIDRKLLHVLDDDHDALELGKLSLSS
jgi:hypothetical protein